MTENPTVDEFRIACELNEAALSAHELLGQERRRARAALQALECGAAFMVPVEIEDGIWDEFESGCLLPAGHRGSHQDYHRPGSDFPAYTAALAVYQEVDQRHILTAAAWHRAQEVVTSMECAHFHKGAGWPCVLRRGHAGPHEHPTEVVLVL